MNFNKLCEDLIHEIRKDQVKLNNIKNDPEGVLQGKYNNLRKTVEGFGREFTVHELQEHMHDTLIDFLKSKLGEEYQFTYDKNMYPSYIKISYHGYELVLLSVSGGFYHVFSPLNAIEPNKKNVKNLNKILNQAKRNLKCVEREEKNPFIIIPIKIRYRDAEERVDQYKKQINAEINRLTKRVSSIQKQTKELEEIKDQLLTAITNIENLFKKYGITRAL